MWILFRRRIIYGLYFLAVISAAPVSVNAEVTPADMSSLIEIQNRHMQSIPNIVPDGLLIPSQKSNALILTRTYIDDLPKVDGGAAWKCLTEALYFEARGESIKGQFAVAEVIINRAKSSRFPNTICAVINQGANGRKYRCQFTYKCDGLPEYYGNKKSYDRVAKVAKLALDGAAPKLTNGATYYHTKAVRPSWSQKFKRTITIDSHHFYAYSR